MSDKTRKIWALSQGSYSDYQVLALFTTKKAAKAAVIAQAADEDQNWSEPGVEVFYLYDEVPDKTTVYEIREELWDDGTTEHYWERITTRLPWNHWNAPPPNGRPRVRFIRDPMHNNKGGRLEVAGYDEQAVRQAFGDRKGMERAKKLGLTL